MEAASRPRVDGDNDPLADQFVHLTSLNADPWNASLRRNERVASRLQRPANDHD